MEITFFKAHRFFKRLRFLPFAACSLFLFQECTTHEHSYHYPRQKEISDPLGLPISSHTLYFPFEIGQQKTGIDSLPTVWASFKLNLMNEPVLYNYYLNTDLFRLTVFPSFSPVKTFKFYKQGNDVHVVVKTLKKNAMRFPGTSQIAVNEDGTIDTTRHLEEKTFPEFESQAFILKNKWDELLAHVTKTRFFAFANTSDHMGLDGTTYILEQHSADHYWFVKRWSPCMSQFDSKNRDCDFKNLCDYFLQLVDASESHAF